MDRTPHRFARAELAALPTLAQGTSEGVSYRLIAEVNGERVWAAEDGRHVRVERFTGGPDGWREIDRYDTEDSNGKQSGS